MLKSDIDAEQSIASFIVDCLKHHLDTKILPEQKLLVNVNFVPFLFVMGQI